MIRVLPLLMLAFEVWMIVDAIRKRQPYYWFLVIIFVPFGSLIYFFMVKIDDFKGKGPKLRVLTRSQPTVDELRHRYRGSSSIDSRMALARRLADAGRHEEAIVEFEGILASRPDESDALWGLSMSRAALGELEEASTAMAKLVATSPSYNDWEGWVMLAGMQHKLGLRSDSLDTLRTLVRKRAFADHQLLLAQALLAADRYDEAGEMLDRIIDDHQHAPAFIRRRDRRVATRARRLRDDMARARARAAKGTARPT